MGVLQIPANSPDDPNDPVFPDGVTETDLVYRSGTTKPAVHRNGRQFALTGTFKFNKFPEGADSIFCAVGTWVCRVRRGG